MNVTIYDIAKEASVSIATVSRVLNKNPRVSAITRARVTEVAKRLHYTPHVSAQSLARKSTKLVSAVIPVVTNYFYMEVLKGLQDALIESDYDLLVYSVDGHDSVDAQLGRALQKGRGDGVLLFSVPMTDDRVSMMKQAGQPVVMVDAFDPNFDSVSVDNVAGAANAVKELYKSGRRKIALITAAPTSKPSLARLEGYKKALTESGLELDESLILSTIEGDENGFSEAAGFAVTNKLLSSGNKFDAIFASSDIQALGVMRALSEANISIPETVSVVGFDNISISQYVGLSTMAQPMREMGRLAMQKMLRRLANPSSPVSHTMFSPLFIGRKTTINAAEIKNQKRGQV